MSSGTYERCGEIKCILRAIVFWSSACHFSINLPFLYLQAAIILVEHHEQNGLEILHIYSACWISASKHSTPSPCVYKWQLHESSAKIDNLLVNKWPQPSIFTSWGHYFEWWMWLSVHIYMHKTHHTHNCFCQKGPKEQGINGSYMFPSFSIKDNKHYIYRAINNPPFCMLLNLNSYICLACTSIISRSNTMTNTSFVR